MLSNGTDQFLEIFLLEKKRVLARLYDVHKALANKPSHFLIQLEKDLTGEYSAIMQQEEEY